MATIQEAQNAVAASQEAVKTAQKRQSDALKALDKERNAPVERLLELSQEVREAQTAVSIAEASVSKAERDVKSAEWQEKAASLAAVTAPVQSAVKDIVAPHFEQMQNLQVDGMLLDIKTDGTVSVKMYGPGVPKSSAPRAAASNGGNGARARYSYVLNGESFTSRELVERFGPEHLTGNVTADMILADPTKHGLTHKADALARKLNAEKRPTTTE